MPSQSSNNSGSSGSGNGGYTVTSSGTNSQVSLLKDSAASQVAILIMTQGNSYDARDYGSSASNSNSYHYSNTDGSYYYSNPNGST